MISSTSGVAGTENNAVPTAGKTTTNANDVQDRFLKLLVAQMRNQDPLNPLDNAQVTSQMAQLSTVSGIEKLNATMQAFTQSQSFQSVGMIGHHVLAAGEFINLSDSIGAAGFDLADAADKVKVSIIDANGNVVRHLDMGDQPSGVGMFQWDGTNDAGDVVEDGNYHFTIEASNAGKPVGATNLAVGLVQSVLMDAAGPSLSVQGMGLVGLTDVKQVL